MDAAGVVALVGVALAVVYFLAVVRAAGEAMAPWYVKAVVCVAATAALAVFAPVVALPVGLGLFGLLMFLPWWLTIVMNKRVAAGRSAVAPARVATALHPFNRWRTMPDGIAALVAMSAGDELASEAAFDRLDRRGFREDRLWLQRDWTGLAEMLEPQEDGLDPHGAFLLARARCEIDRVNDGVRGWLAVIESGHPDRAHHSVILVAHCGLPGLVERESSYTEAEWIFWLASACQRAGDLGRATALLNDLASSHPGRPADLAGDRLAQPLRPIGELDLDPELRRRLLVEGAPHLIHPSDGFGPEA